MEEKIGFRYHQNYSMTLETSTNSVNKDFFCPCSGNSDTQLEAISDFIEEEVFKAGEKVLGNEKERIANNGF